MAEVVGSNSDIKLTRKYQIRLECPNPLFEVWLEQWYYEATKKNLYIQHIFKKALESLRKFPLTIMTGRECIILEHFSPDLCRKLDRKLKELNGLNTSAAGFGATNLVKSENIVQLKNEKATESSPRRTNVNKDADHSKRTNGKRKEYIPTKGTGSYALLVALLNNHSLFGEQATMTKEELINEAQQLCDVSLTRPPPGTYYTGWSSIGILCRKSLVVKIEMGRSARYKLTEAGIVLAKQLKRAAIETDSGVSVDGTFDVEKSDGLFSQNNISQLRPMGKYDNPKSKTIPTITPSVHTFSSSDDEMEETSYARRLCDGGELKYQVGMKNDCALAFETRINDTHSAVIGIIPKCMTTFTTTGSIGWYGISQIADGLPQFLLDHPLTSQPQIATAINSTSFLSSSPTKCPCPSFKLILLIDSCETNGKLGENATKHKLSTMGVACEVRHLNVGDYLWVCRDAGGNDLILPYIIERKRIDDLAKSIKDGRFHEQKLRLKSAPVKQRIYIVEGHGKAHTALPMSTLMQAASNTHIVDRFVVKHTANHLHTLKYLASLHTLFIRKLHGKILKECTTEVPPPFDWANNSLELLPFEMFMKNCSKKRKFTVREMLMRQLVQLHGVSVEKAKAVVEMYPCPRLLLDLSRSSGNDEILQEIKVGRLESSIGPAISKTLYQLYTKDRFN